MSVSYQYKFLSYEQAVKHTHCHENLGLINAYVQMGLERAQSYQDQAATKAAHLRIYYTLEETLCDPLHPEHWRLHCKRMLRRLLPLMHELFSPTQYLKLVTRLNEYERYFLPKAC